MRLLPVPACACCLQNVDDTATATDVPEASAHVDEPAPSPAGSAEAHGTPAPMPGSAIGGLTPVLGQTPGAGWRQQSLGGDHDVFVHMCCDGLDAVRMRMLKMLQIVLCAHVVHAVCGSGWRPA